MRSASSLPFLATRSLHGGGHVARHRLDIEGLREDLHLAALDLGQVEHVVDQAEQVARIALDLAHVLGQGRGSPPSLISSVSISL